MMKLSYPGKLQARLFRVTGMPTGAGHDETIISSASVGVADGSAECIDPSARRGSREPDPASERVVLTRVVLAVKNHERTWRPFHRRNPRLYGSAGVVGTPQLSRVENRLMEQSAFVDAPVALCGSRT